MFQTLSLAEVNEKTQHVKLHMEAKQQENQRLFRGVESQTGNMILEKVCT